ncbi:MAG: hypothetical protein ACRC00_05795, partial [Exiguobacterium acetylicum]
SDIFFQEKFMLNGIDIKIRMIRGKDEFCLMTKDDVAYKLNIVSASLFVKNIETVTHTDWVPHIKSGKFTAPAPRSVRSTRLKSSDLFAFHRGLGHVECQRFRVFFTYSIHWIEAFE